MKTFLFHLSRALLFLLFPLPMLAQDFADAFPLKWQYAIGLTTYRTNIIYHKKERAIVVGSNGEKRNKFNDRMDGLYVLDAETGTQKLFIHQDGPIDGDVNGVAADKHHLYFGDDNGRFYCYDFNGIKQWEYTVPVKRSRYDKGDIEAPPVLISLNGDRHDDVVISAEGVGILAIDGQNGHPLWEFKDSVKHYGMTAPAIHDFNGDGQMDIIAGSRWYKPLPSPEGYQGITAYHYGDFLFYLDGRSGEEIMRVPARSRIHASPLVLLYPDKEEIIHAESYSAVYGLSTDSLIHWRLNIGMPNGGISGFFSSPVVNAQNRLFIGTSWWGEEDGIWVANTRKRNKRLIVEPDACKLTRAGRVSASAVVADIIPNQVGMETLMCSEKGEAFIFNERGTLLKRLTLPDGVEATPLIADIDRDRKLEILIATLNGNLYCYDTNSRGDVLIGQFRGNNKNTGRIDMP